MIYKLKITLSLLKFFILIFLYSSVTLANYSCSDLFTNTDLNDCTGLNCPHEFGTRLWGRFGHNIPIFTKFLNPSLSEAHVELLRLSYEKSKNGNPVEFGIIQMYDNRGRLIDSSAPIEGGYRHILMNQAFLDVIKNTRRDYSDIDRIVVAHTHPIDYKNDTGQVSKNFSESDIKADKAKREWLNKKPELKHVKVDNLIIYFNLEVVGGSSFNPIRILSDYNFCLTNDVVKVIGYQQ